jgi:hypothetical protein
MDGLRRLNLTDALKGNWVVDPATVPTLVPEEIMSRWTEGDEDPYFKIQKIEYPIRANRLNYQESFFESYLAKLRDHPIPGAKSGHSPSDFARSPTDFVLVGGKLISNGDGTGYVLLKNYVPKVGESGDNSVFIRECQSKMVHFSIVTYPKVESLTDGNGAREENVVESMYGERNDAVDWGVGAMKQETNARVTNPEPKSDETEDDFVERCIPVLIGEGKKPGQAAAVCHSVYQQKQENSIEPAVGGLEDIEEGETMTKEEFMKVVNSLATAKVTLSEIAEAMGEARSLVTPEYVEALRVVNALKAEGVKDPVTEITSLRKTVRDNEAVVRNAALDTAFGAQEKDEKGNDKNLLRKYAAQQVGEAVGEELTKRVNSMKEDPVARKLSADKADPASSQNAVGSVDHRDDAPALDSNRRVDEM